MKSILICCKTQMTSTFIGTVKVNCIRNAFTMQFNFYACAYCLLCLRYISIFPIEKFNIKFNTNPVN